MKFEVSLLFHLDQQGQGGSIVLVEEGLMSAFSLCMNDGDDLKSPKIERGRCLHDSGVVQVAASFACLIVRKDLESV